jgi:hypothetical protein
MSILVRQGTDEVVTFHSWFCATVLKVDAHAVKMRKKTPAPETTEEDAEGDDDAARAVSRRPGGGGTGGGDLDMCEEKTRDARQASLEMQRWQAIKRQKTDVGE